MTNDEWSRAVLKQFWPRKVNDQTPMPPEAMELAGKIWNRWLEMRGFTGAVAVLAKHNRYTPPTPLWLATVIGSAAWQAFTNNEIDWVFRKGIVNQLSLVVELALNGQAVELY